ncbi:MAG: hypothetical protein H0T46_01805 [Deltaproteobacteria bacterium]|nr:hypothetical protein [Deltaproteobacteria bacterium]
MRQLDDELAAVLLRVDALVADHGFRDELVPALAKLEVTRAALRERVIACVACVAAYGAQWSGTLMQTRVLVVLAQLAMLRDAALDLPPDARLYGDAFSSTDALSAHIVRGIERVTAGLERERQIADRIDRAAVRAAWEQVALGKAEAGFAALGHDDRILRALRAGARMPSLRFTIACRALLLSLDARLDPAELIPDLPPLRRMPGESS